MKVKIKNEEYEAVSSIINIIEEIYNDNQFYDYCTTIYSDVEKNRLYKNNLFEKRLLEYHKQVSVLYPKITNSDFTWVLDMFSMEFLNNKNFIERFTNEMETVNLHVCLSCKQIFFGNMKDMLCEQCKKHSLIIFN